jgi:hypothetical protein
MERALNSAPFSLGRRVGDEGSGVVSLIKFSVQSYVRVGKYAFFKQSRYRVARQLKRARQRLRENCGLTWAV